VARLPLLNNEKTVTVTQILTKATSFIMSIEPWVNVELKHGLSKQTDPWGRRVIQAIDMDDCIAMFEVFDDRNNNKSSGPKNINSQVTLFGYGEYIWTSYVHRYIGDTALHLAIKQKKMMCLHMLLILKANPTILNASFVSAEDLCKQFLGTSALNLAYESMKYILNNLNPKQFKRMPDSALYRSLQNEAWMLLREGRIMYSELPASLNTANLEVISATEKKSYLSFNVPPPSSADDGGSVGTIDSNEMLLMEVGPVRRWVKMTDATTGMEYFFDEVISMFCQFLNHQLTQSSCLASHLGRCPWTGKPPLPPPHLPRPALSPAVWPALSTTAIWTGPTTRGTTTGPR
jgi:hypothetical protein